MSEIIIILFLAAVCLAMLAVCLFMLKIPLTAAVIGAGVILAVHIICRFLLVRDAARREHEIALIRLGYDGVLTQENIGEGIPRIRAYTAIEERRAL